MEFFEKEESNEFSGDTVSSSVDIVEDDSPDIEALRETIEFPDLLNRLEILNNTYPIMTELSETVTECVTKLQEANYTSMTWQEIKDSVFDSDDQKSKEKGMFFLQKLRAVNKKEPDVIKDESTLAVILAVQLIMLGVDEDVKADGRKAPFLKTLVSNLQMAAYDSTGQKSTNEICDQVRNDLNNMMRDFLINKSQDKRLILKVLNACGALAYYLYIETVICTQASICHYSEFALPLLERICGYLNVRFNTRGEKGLEMDLKKTGAEVENVLREVVKNSNLDDLARLQKVVDNQNSASFSVLIQRIWEQANAYLYPTKRAKRGSKTL